MGPLHIHVNGYYTWLHKGQSHIHSCIRTPDFCLIDFLSDRFLTGPAIPWSGFPPVRDYQTTNLPPSTGSRNVNITLTVLPATLRDNLSALATGLLGIPRPPWTQDCGLASPGSPGRSHSPEYPSLQKNGTAAVLSPDNKEIEHRSRKHATAHRERRVVQASTSGQMPAVPQHRSYIGRILVSLRQPSTSGQMPAVPQHRSYIGRILVSLRQPRTTL